MKKAVFRLTIVYFIYIISPAKLHSQSFFLENDTSKLQHEKESIFHLSFSDSSSSVHTLSTNDFNRGQITSWEQLIIGRVPGLLIKGQDGRPGTPLFLDVRGFSFLTSNEPLIIIDGFIMDNALLENNTLQFLNPNDIESISVLKDAAATSRYGSRASTGAILISTKKGGKDAKPQINFRSTTSLAATKRTIDSNPLFVSKEFPIRTKIIQDNGISAHGSFKSIPYYISFSHLYQPGIIEFTGLKRSTTSINLNPEFLDKHLKVNLSYKGSLLKQDFSSTETKAYNNSGLANASFEYILPFFPSLRLRFNSGLYHVQLKQEGRTSTIYHDRNIESQLAYSPQLRDKNKIEVFAGVASQTAGYYHEGTTDYHFPALNNYPTLNLDSTVPKNNVNSLLGGATYGFKDKLFISTNIRIDESLKFTSLKTSIYSSSLGFAWKILDKTKTTNAGLDKLMLRTSFGKSGSFLYKLDDQNLKPFNVNHFNSGFDISIKNRVSLSFDFYNRMNIEPILFNLRKYRSPFSFYSYEYSATFYNKGFDLSLDYSFIQTKEFIWNAGLNTSFVHSEVIDVPELHHRKNYLIFKSGWPPYALDENKPIDPNFMLGIYSDLKNDKWAAKILFRAHSGNFMWGSEEPQNASFFRLEFAQLAYNIGSVLNKANININITLQNPFVLSPYKGVDPEGIWGENSGYPFPRPETLSFGLNVQFK